MNTSYQKMKGGKSNLAETCKVDGQFMEKLSKIELTIIFDNISYSKQLQTQWGYSCLIETANDTILFDTGSDAKILLSNMSQLQVDPNSINSIFISHNHYDHLDGLAEFLRINPNVTVYIPHSFDRKIENQIVKTGADVIRIKSAREIAINVYSLGQLRLSVAEQSIALLTSKGLVLITGCAHPGIINIIKKAQSIFPDEQIYLAIGGFHLKNDNNEIINQTIRTIYDLNVSHVAPSHCTGDDAIKEFENVYQNNCIKSGVGKKIIIEGGE